LQHLFRVDICNDDWCVQHAGEYAVAAEITISLFVACSLRGQALSALDIIITSSALIRRLCCCCCCCCWRTCLRNRNPRTNANAIWRTHAESVWTSCCTVGISTPLLVTAWFVPFHPVAQADYRSSFIQVLSGIIERNGSFLRFAWRRHFDTQLNVEGSKADW